MTDSLETRFTSRNERALARGISLLEADDAAGGALLRRYAPGAAGRTSSA